MGLSWSLSSYHPTRSAAPLSSSTSSFRSSLTSLSACTGSVAWEPFSWCRGGGRSSRATGRGTEGCGRWRGGCGAGLRSRREGVGPVGVRRRRRCASVVFVGWCWAVLVMELCLLRRSLDSSPERQLWNLCVFLFVLQMDKCGVRDTQAEQQLECTEYSMEAHSR